MPAHSRRAPTALFAFLLALPAALAAALPAKLPASADSIVSYDIAVSLDAEKKELTGRERIVWRNPSTDPADAVSDLWFHLYWNAFRNNRSTFFVESGGQLRRDKAEIDGWGWTDITSLKLATGEDLLPSLTFEHPDDDNADDRTVARVLLPTPVAPGGEITIDLEFHAKVPKVFARAGYKDDFLAVTQWFPKLGVWEPAGMRGREKSGWNCHQYHANTEVNARPLAPYQAPRPNATGSMVKAPRGWESNPTTAAKSAAPAEIACTAEISELLPVAQPLRTLRNGTPVSPSSVTSVSALPADMLPPTAYWMSGQDSEASANA